jgi:hypothetical protein
LVIVDGFVLIIVFLMVLVRIVMLLLRLMRSPTIRYLRGDVASSSTSDWPVIVRHVLIYATVTETRVEVFLWARGIQSK